MLNTRLYIVQVVGIIAILCGYFLSDQPDSLSVMHFDPSSPSVISKAEKQGVEQSVHLSISSGANSNHKPAVAKHISFEIMLPFEAGYLVCNYATVTYAASLPVRYNFLFYKEINPPPPKAC